MSRTKPLLPDDLETSMHSCRSSSQAIKTHSCCQETGVWVDGITRQRLALDLVMKPYNDIYRDIINQALKAI
ncbi:hypothetical protein RIF29_36315 [Crotalaria pallida]|uniref:Uncharacterized protein n=1 Tax=Crotalaria pallida TaxID=3830 RepID=A0AAN9EBC9_CROPI